MSMHELWLLLFQGDEHKECHSFIHVSAICTIIGIAKGLSTGLWGAGMLLSTACMSSLTEPAPLGDSSFSAASADP